MLRTRTLARKIASGCKGRTRLASVASLRSPAALLIPLQRPFPSLGRRPVVCGTPGAVGDSQSGFLRCTRLLFSGAKRQFSKVEALSFDAAFRARTNDPLGTTMLELNLLEDPTAGLATGPAEELTPTELETRVRVLVSGYTPSLYRLLYMSFVDVVSLLVQEGLVPTADTGAVQCSTSTDASNEGGVARATGGAGASTVSTSFRPVRPEEIMARWFTDGPTTMKSPHATAEAMGKRRWNMFCRALEAHWATVEDVMPLTRVVLRHHLREDLYIPLFRQLAMELIDPTKRASAVATLPGIILSLANGRAPRSLGLPENDAERVGLVSDLFLGVAQETGNTDLAYLAVQLLRANNMPTPFSAQKQLTNVFAAASRIETDWQMRATSMLIGSYSKWLEYFKRVQQDNRVALEELHQGGATTATNDSTEVREDVVSSSASRTSSASRKKKASAVVERKDTNEYKGSVADSRPSGAAADTSSALSGERSTEQYRYFTSRQEDGVTRVTALERNIDAALRSRAAALLEAQMDRRRKRNKDQPELSASRTSGCDDLSAMPVSPSAPYSLRPTSPLNTTQGNLSGEGIRRDADVRVVKGGERDDLPREDATSKSRRASSRKPLRTTHTRGRSGAGASRGK